MGNIFWSLECKEVLQLSQPDSYIPLVDTPEFICKNILTWLCFSILILVSAHERKAKRNKYSPTSRCNHLS